MNDSIIEEAAERVVEGQIYGAALQGMGYGLKEEMLFDRMYEIPMTPERVLKALGKI